MSMLEYNISFLNEYSNLTEVDIMIKMCTDTYIATIFKEFVEYIDKSIMEQKQFEGHLKEHIKNHLRSYSMEVLYSM